MLKSQELQIKMSKIRNELNNLKDTDEGVIEKRSELVENLTTAESEYQAAVATESSLATEAAQGGQNSLTPLVELRSRVQVSEYVRAAVERRNIAGAAHEYNSELGHDVAGSHVPVELLADGIPEVEQRADAVTNLGADVVNRRPAGRFLDRVMAGTHAAFLGIQFDSVGVGQPLHTIMTGGTTAAMRAKNQEQDAVAANFTIETLSPKRLTARYVWTLEDQAKLAGLEVALRRDLARVMAEHMDYTIIAGDDSATGNDADIAGLLGDAANVPATDVVGTNADSVTMSSLLAALAGKVDGYYARVPSDIAMLISVGLNINLLSTFTNAQQTELKGDTISRVGYRRQVHEKLDSNAAIADDEVIALGSRARHLTGVGVAAMWPTVSLITDPYSGASRGQIALTAIGLWDFKVLRANSFFKLTADLS